MLTRQQKLASLRKGDAGVYARGRVHGGSVLVPEDRPEDDDENNQDTSNGENGGFFHPSRIIDLGNENQNESLIFFVLSLVRG